MSKHGIGGDGIVAHWMRGGRPDSTVIGRMSKAAPHRGGNLRSLAHGTAVLGVTGRNDPGGLATVGAWLVAYAGVIDNPEVLDVASIRDTTGDQVAAALAESIDRNGFESTVEALRGVFSIVATDGASLSCARDQVGFSSLFYRDDGTGVWVASEAKQIVAGAGIRREPNLDVIEHIFFGLTDLEMPAALEGISRIPRHHTVRFTHSGKVSRRVFDPAALLETSSTKLGDVPDVFHHLMDQSVRRVMRGPDALALSGGIDSPAVAAYAAPAHLEMFGTPLAAMSNVYPNHPYVDERKYIEPVSEYYGMPLRTNEPKAKPTDRLEEWVSLLDGPFPVVSIAESAELYGWVRSVGFEILMTGEFAEFVTDANNNLLSHLILRGRLGASVRRLGTQRRAGVSSRTLARDVAKAVAPRTLVKGYRRAKGHPVSVVRPPWITHGPTPPQYLDVPLRRRWNQEQVSFFGGAAVLLEVHDLLQTLFGIKVRQPWADLDLWMFFLSMRAEVKYAYPTSKGLMRNVLRGRVPDFILDRRDKTVFDDNLRSKIDRDALARWLVDPRVKMPWINYDLLADAIAKPDLSIREFMWMKDLAGVHAFLETW